MIIKGAKVYTEEGIFADKEVCITGEVFTETGGDGEKWLTQRLLSDSGTDRYSFSWLHGKGFL